MVHAAFNGEKRSLPQQWSAKLVDAPGIGSFATRARPRPETAWNWFRRTRTSWKRSDKSSEYTSSLQAMRYTGPMTDSAPMRASMKSTTAAVIWLFVKQKRKDRSG